MIESESQLQECDESAHSIEPSRWSRISKSSMVSGRETTPLIHRAFGFDDELYNSRAYKRNHEYKTNAAQVRKDLVSTRERTEEDRIPAEASDRNSTVLLRAASRSYDGLKKERAARMDILTRVTAACLRDDAPSINQDLRKHPAILGEIPTTVLTGILGRIAERGYTSAMVAMISHIKDEGLWQSVNGKSLLFKAAARGHVKLTGFLMESGVPGDSHDSDGNFAIHHAVSAKAYSVIWLLLIDGYRIDWPNNRGQSPLSKAIFLPDRKIVAQMLFAQGSQLTLAEQEQLLRITVALEKERREPDLEELKLIYSMIRAFYLLSPSIYNYTALDEILNDIDHEYWYNDLENLEASS